MDTITLTVESANQFTFTCISVDGPVARVSWYRNSINLGLGQKELNDPLTARYTLTVIELQLQTGRYSCTTYTDSVSGGSKTLAVSGKIFSLHFVVSFIPFSQVVLVICQCLELD